MKTEQLENITLVNGDCMEYLRSLPDKAFSLAVVDPPYGGANGGGNMTGSEDDLRDTSVPNSPEISCARTGGTWAHKYGKHIVGWDVAPQQEYFDELFRVSENQIIFGGNYFNLPPTRCFVIYEKTNIPREGFTMAPVEYAWTSFNRNAMIGGFHSGGTCNNVRFHPTQKPVELYTWILNHFAKPGDTILDTFGGSMSSMVACFELGFTATCIELDEIYYGKAKERLQKRMAEMHLPLSY